MVSGKLYRTLLTQENNQRSASRTWYPLFTLLILIFQAYIVLCTRYTPHPVKGPTAFSQMHVLALLVDFLFLNRYIESDVLAPHSVVGRIVRRIPRWKK